MMQTSEQPKIRFLGISIVSVDLKVVQQYVSDQKADLNVDAKLLQRDANSKDFRIWMAIDLIVPEYWEVKVSGFGDFEFGADISEAEQKALINVNAPAVMFPYFRSFVSTLTSNCGASIPRIIIPPQLFQGVLEELQPVD